MSIYDKHHILNPIGKPEPVCESIGHKWEERGFNDHVYRFCIRCDRLEVKHVYSIGGFGVSTWMAINAWNTRSEKELVELNKHDLTMVLTGWGINQAAKLADVIMERFGTRKS